MDRVGAALAVTLAVGLVACSQPGSAPPTSTPSTVTSSAVTSTSVATTTSEAPTTSAAPTTTEAPTTTAVPTTTSTAPTTTLGPSGECVVETEVPIDAAAQAVVSVVGDVDGDGFDDTVTGYLIGSANPVEAAGAVLHVELASGYTTDIDVDQLGLGFEAVLARPETVVSMDGDRLIVAAVAGILPGELYGFFVLDDCVLSVVDTAGGSIPEVWVGGGAAHDDWFSCGPDSVTMAQFGYTDATATPRTYETGQVEEFVYEAPVFNPTGPADPDVPLPASQDEVESAYPRCVG